MRAFFLRRSWRERALLLLTLAVGVGIWLASLAGRARDFKMRWQVAGASLDNQASWLGNAASLEAKVKTQLAQVQQGRSLNSLQLGGQLDAVVKKAGFAFRLDTPVTTNRPPVAIHTVTLTLEKAELSAFIAFIGDLGVALPLVNIEQLSITPDRRTLTGQLATPADRQPLDVRLKLSSLEVLAP